MSAQTVKRENNGPIYQPYRPGGRPATFAKTHFMKSMPNLRQTAMTPGLLQPPAMPMPRYYASLAESPVPTSAHPQTSSSAMTSNPVTMADMAYVNYLTQQHRDMLTSPSLVSLAKQRENAKGAGRSQKTKQKRLTKRPPPSLAPPSFTDFKSTLPEKFMSNTNDRSSSLKKGLAAVKKISARVKGTHEHGRCKSTDPRTHLRDVSSTAPEPVSSPGITNGTVLNLQQCADINIDEIKLFREDDEEEADDDMDDEETEVQDDDVVILGMAVMKKGTAVWLDGKKEIRRVVKEAKDRDLIAQAQRY